MNKLFCNSAPVFTSCLCEDWRSAQDESLGTSQHFAIKCLALKMYVPFLIMQQTFKILYSQCVILQSLILSMGFSPSIAFPSWFLLPQHVVADNFSFKCVWEKAPYEDTSTTRIFIFVWKKCNLWHQLFRKLSQMPTATNLLRMGLYCLLCY